MLAALCSNGKPAGGLAFHGVAELVVSGAWFLVLIIAGPLAAQFLIEQLHYSIGEELLPNGIRSARKPQTKPEVWLLWRLSLPVGRMPGIVLTALGLDDPLTGWLFQAP